MHNLDITNGVASFVSAREDAWHAMGEVLPDSFTAEEALKYGKLGGWNLRKTALFTEVDGKKILTPDMYAVVRNNPVVKGQRDVLGVVGNKYTIIQNEDLATLLNALVDESGAHFETAGAIDGGRKVFITMKLPGNIKIGGVDRVDNYIAIMTSHDGTTSTQIMVTPIRIVCQNTLNMAFNGAKHAGVFRVRHTVGAHKIMLQQAREALDFTFDFIEDFQADAEKLINTTMTQLQFEEIIHEAFGAPADAPLGTLTRTENKLDTMMNLYADANTQEGIRGTAWAGLNALTEWYDHFSHVRGAGVNTGTEEVLRSRRALLDPSFKNQALKMMMELV